MLQYSLPTHAPLQSVAYIVEAELSCLEDADSCSKEDEEHKGIGQCSGEDDQPPLPRVPLLAPLLQVCYLLLGRGRGRGGR